MLKVNYVQLAIQKVYILHIFRQGLWLMHAHCVIVECNLEAWLYSFQILLPRKKTKKGVFLLFRYFLQSKIWCLRQYISILPYVSWQHFYHITAKKPTQFFFAISLNTIKLSIPFVWLIVNGRCIFVFRYLTDSTIATIKCFP